MGEIINRKMDSIIERAASYSPPARAKKTGEVSIENGQVVINLTNQERTIRIAGQQTPITAIQLMRMIKEVTQSIGDYKASNNAYALYVIPALRKARSDMVSDLENNFGLTWQIDSASGESKFFKK